MEEQTMSKDISGSISPERLAEITKQKEDLEKKLEQRKKQLSENIDALIEQSKDDDRKYELTELGNGERYADTFGNKFKFIIEEKQWVKWNGLRWERDHDGQTYRNIKEILKQIKEEIKPKVELYENLLAASMQSDNGQIENALKRVGAQIKEIKRWHKNSQTHKRIQDTLASAANQEGMSRHITDMDSKGNYLGVKNGVLDLRVNKFKLVSGNPDYFMMNTCSVEYDPNADCPEWKNFLLKIMKGDEELVQFLQRLVGQGILGYSDKDKLAIFYGTGANGKSTLVGTLKDVLGDYATVTDPKVIMEGRSTEEYYLATLKGVRSLFMSESKRGGHIASEVVKKLLGGEEITARFPHGRVFKFQPTLTPILSTNHKPKVTDMCYVPH